MARKRRTKSSIARLPPEQRAFIEKMLREDRLTLDGIKAELERKFPGEPAADVSRSAIHRYEKGFSAMTQRMREIDRAAQALVGELGDGIGEKSGALLAQAVTTLATDAALKAHADDDTTIEDVRKIARAAKDAMDTTRVGINVRRTIAAEAREKLLREQQSNLDKIVKSGGLSDEAAKSIREKILGVA